MKLITFGALALAASSTSALALGLDRSSQDITAMFEPGGYVELSYGFTQPACLVKTTLGTPSTTSASTTARSRWPSRWTWARTSPSA